MNNYNIPGMSDIYMDNAKLRLHNPEISNAMIIYVSGFLDTYNSNQFQRKMALLPENGFVNLIFNLSGTSYVSSTGIGAFTEFLKMVKPKGGTIILTNVLPKVYEIFQLLGFTSFFTFTTSIDSALELLSKPTIEQITFPAIVQCPICSKKLKATRSGRFRCNGCKTVIAITEEAEVRLG